MSLTARQTEAWVGYEVVGEGGRVGTVEAVRVGGRPRRPLALVVRMSDTFFLLPLTRVVEVREREREIAVR